MRYILSDRIEKEIPDEWWNEAGMGGFVRIGSCYARGPDPQRPDAPIIIVPISDIRPPYRGPGVVLDFGGFRRDRMIRILTGFASGNAIPPIVLNPTTQDTYCYKVQEGWHRFHASVAVGFTHVPGIEFPEFFG